jgi:hypothetical protein
VSFEPSSVDPGGLDVVGRWVERLYAPYPGDELWSALDITLRVALAQGWILDVGAEPDDLLVAQLAVAAPTGTVAEDMLDDLIEDWRTVYQDLADGFGRLDQIVVVGVDLELVALASARYIGRHTAGAVIPVHEFVTRLSDSTVASGRRPSWSIAAFGAWLPVPGWPPGRQMLPGFEP